MDVGTHLDCDVGGGGYQMEYQNMSMYFENRMHKNPVRGNILSQRLQCR